MAQIVVFVTVLPVLATLLTVIGRESYSSLDEEISVIKCKRMTDRICLKVEKTLRKRRIPSNSHHTEKIVTPTLKFTLKC